MNTKVRGELTAAGIDADTLWERCMRSERMILRLLQLFLQDTNYEKLKEALEKGDKEGALQASHTLKGVTGNLGFQTLFDKLTEQVYALRKEDMEKAGALMREITPLYETAEEHVKKAAEA